MSRESLGDELRREGPSLETYQMSSPGYDMDYVERLVDDFISSPIFGDLGIYSTRTWRSKLHYVHRDELKSFPGLDDQAFLDAVVAQLARRGEEYESYKTGLMLTPVVNTLYMLGYNGLSLNVISLSSGKGPWPELVGEDLHGTEDAPLELTCETGTGSLEETLFRVGLQCEYVKVNAVGDMECLGNHTEHSELILDGRVRILGYGAKNSVFRLLNTELMAEFRGTVPVAVQRFGYHMINSSGKAWFCLREGRMHRMHIREEFWKDGNELYCSDGEGGWKEVTP